MYAIILIAAQCKGQSEVAKIEFSSLTRGYQKQVFIDKDSLIVMVDGRQDDNKVVKRKIAPEVWQGLVGELRNVKVKDMESYKSPSNRRAFDGAKHSTIRVISADGTAVSHTFDDLDPHADLKQLLKLILKAENSQ
jgi:hypothetical protein